MGLVYVLVLFQPGSQEIGHKGFIRDGFGRLVLESMEDLERSIKLFVYIQQRSLVSAPVAVVGSRPDCDEVLVLEPVLIALHHKLVSSCDEIDVVDMIEFLGNYRAIEPSCSSGRHSPSINIFWIGPHEVAERTHVRDLLSSVNESGLVEGLDFRREASMDTEYLPFDECSDTEIVENFSAVLPWVRIPIFSDSFVVEAVD